MSGPQSTPVGPGGAPSGSDPQTVAALAILTQLVSSMAAKSNQGGTDMSDSIDTNIQSPTGQPPPPQGPASTTGAPIMPAQPSGATDGDIQAKAGKASRGGAGPTGVKGPMFPKFNAVSTAGPKPISPTGTGMQRSLLGKPPPAVANLGKPPPKGVQVPKPPKGKLPD